jgi:hypothetical protein
MEITGVYHSKSGHTIRFKIENESDPDMYNNEPYICITLDKVSKTINSLKLKGNYSAGSIQSKTFHATIDEYTNFLNNVLDKEVNWKVENRNREEVTIPGTWSKDTTDEESKPRGGKSRKTKKRKQRKSYKRRK